MKNAQWELFINGEFFDGATSIRVSKGINKIYPELTFSTVRKKQRIGEKLVALFPIRDGDKILMNVEGRAFFTGFIKDITLDSQSNVVNVTCVPSTYGLVSTAKQKIYKHKNIEYLIKALLLDNNQSFLFESYTKNNILEKIIPIDQRTTLESYISQIATLNDFIVTTNNEGNLIAIDEGTEQSSGYLYSAIDTTETKDNVENISYKKSLRPKLVDLVAENETSSSRKNMLTQYISISDDTANNTIQDLIYVKQNANKKTLKTVARAKIARNRSETNKISLTVYSWKIARDSKNLWEINTVVKLTDEQQRFQNREYLIEEIEYSQEQGDKQITNLILVNRGTYSGAVVEYEDYPIYI